MLLHGLAQVMGRHAPTKVLPGLMQRDPTGRYEITCAAGESFRAFLRAPLPPDPSVQLLRPLQALHDRALPACGRLDGVSSLLLLDPVLFLNAYVRREALLSSQIEGIQLSLAARLLFELDEAPGVPFDDVVEGSSTVAGLEHGLAQLAEGFALSCRRLFAHDPYLGQFSARALSRSDRAIHGPSLAALPSHRQRHGRQPGVSR